MNAYHFQNPISPDDIETAVTELNRLIAYLEVCESLVMDRVQDVHLPAEAVDVVVSDIKARLNLVLWRLEKSVV